MNFSKAMGHHHDWSRFENTSNSSNATHCTPLSKSILICYLLRIVYSILIATANAILLYSLISVGRRKRRLGNHFFFVCNFSLVDFFVGVEGLCDGLAVILGYNTKPEKMLNHASFKTLILTSLLLFLCHAFVQWRAVRRPLASHTPPWFIFLLTLASWIVAVAMSGISCWLKFETDLLYSTHYISFKCFELATYLVITMAICLFYALVLTHIRHKHRNGNNVVTEKLRSLLSRAESHRNSTISNAHRPISPRNSIHIISMPSQNGIIQANQIDQDGLRINCGSGRRPYDPRKVYLTSLTVTAVHIACFIPYVVFYGRYFTTDPNDTRGQLVKYYINGIVLTLRSLLLPIIFIARTPEIYSALRHLCRCTQTN